MPEAPRILVAPDKFKGALNACDAAAAIAAGVREAAPSATITEAPLADGGEGTGPLLARAARATERQANILDPLGRPRVARWWLTQNGVAIIEMAEAAGLTLLAPHERRPLQTSSFGVGQLIHAALQAGVTRVKLAVGGSATVDGGAGCLQALGCTLLDAHGAPLPAPIGGGALSRVARIEPPTAPPSFELTVLCDVSNPLLGPQGAAPVFAPQKGAGPGDVAALEAGLRNWARVLAEAFGRAVALLAHSGAAGGLPAGLVAFCGAALRPGFDEVARAVALHERIRDCDLVLTGEGRLDSQSLQGKVVSGVARMANELRKPVCALVGQARPAGQTRAQLANALGLREVVAISPPGEPIDQALRDTATNLRSAAAKLISRWLAGEFA